MEIRREISIVRSDFTGQGAESGHVQCCALDWPLVVLSINPGKLPSLSLPCGPLPPRRSHPAEQPSLVFS